MSVLAHGDAGTGPLRGQAWYWGDLNLREIRFALDATNAVKATAMVVIRPARVLWEAMAAVPMQQSGAIDWTSVGAESWLGPVWRRLEPVRSVRGRVAQEAVPITSIVESIGWFRRHTGTSL